MTIRWFAGDCLSFSQSLQMSFLRVASIFNAVITPYLAHLYGPMTSFYMGIVICFVSVAGAILLLNLDLYYFNKSNDEKIEIQSLSNISRLFLCISLLSTCFYSVSQVFNMYLPENILFFHASSVKS